MYNITANTRKDEDVMEKSILKFEKISDGVYHSIIKNNHGRQIYLKIKRLENVITICECFYIDRSIKNDKKSVPKRWVTKECAEADLSTVLANEMDKRFYDIRFDESINHLSVAEYIENALKYKEKYKFLILISKDGVFKTRLKNRVHRNIYLEIERMGAIGLVRKCNYCDRKYKNNRDVTPAGLNTIYFEYSSDEVLEIVNDELNCDFTDVIITSDTFDFEKRSIPVCGAI